MLDLLEVIRWKWFNDVVKLWRSIRKGLESGSGSAVLVANVPVTFSRTEGVCDLVGRESLMMQFDLKGKKQLRVEG